MNFEAPSQQQRQLQKEDAVLHTFWLNITSKEYHRQNFPCLSSFYFTYDVFQIQS